MARPIAQVHGVLLLDKAAGLSSNAALQRTRKLFDWPKAGHTGTLDPLATGLLPVCFGEATKYSHALLDADKGYEAGIRLGLKSSTGDAEGVLQAVREPQVDLVLLRRVLESFLGVISQVPPMHSALKHDGRPLYDYARAGEEVVRKPRNILIKSINLLDFNGKDELRIHVDCSKGTYIRVLAEDIGEALGCGGYLSALRRTRIADLGVDEATGLEELEALDGAGRLHLLRPIDSLLAGLPAIDLDEPAAKRVCQGLSALLPGAAPGLSRLYGPRQRFLGLGNVAEDGTVAPKRMVSPAASPGEVAVSP